MVTDKDVLNISLADALRFLARGALVAFAAGLLGAAGAYFLSRDPAPLYRATAILLATRPTSGYANTVDVIEPTQIDPDIYRSAIVQGGLMEAALTNLFGEAPDPTEMQTWRKRVRVRVDENLISGLVRIEVDDEVPEVAREVADALSDALLTWDRGRVGRNVQATVTSLHRSLVLIGAQLAAAEQAGDADQVQALKATRDQRLTQLRSAETLSLSAVVMGLLEPFRAAVVDPKPVNERTTFVTAVAFVLCFILAYVGLLVIRVADPRIRSLADFAAATRLPPVAFVPDGARGTRALDAIDRIVVALPSPAPARANATTPPPDDHVPGQPPRAPSVMRSARVIVVTSVASSSERAWLAPQLAATYAQAGWRVLLVDADLVEGRLSASVPHDDRAATLSAVLQHREVGRPTTLMSARGGTLDFVAAGSEPAGGPAALLQHAAPELVAAWRSGYEVVVVDAPAVELSAIVAALAPEVDTVLLTGMAHRTKLRSATIAGPNLTTQIGSATAGAVLLGRRRRRASGADDRLLVPSSRASKPGAEQMERRATVVQRPTRVR